MEYTRREKIINLLMQVREPLTVKAIGNLLGIPPREHYMLYEDLHHIAKTIRKRFKGKNLFMVPPQCSECGFVFKDMKRLRKPSRCPRCKSERILPPRFIIK